MKAADEAAGRPRVIAWELTRRCELACAYCRAGATRAAEAEAGELTTEECLRVLEGIARLARPLIILTGGEALLREDVYEIAGRGSALGMRVVLATCGWGVDEQVTKQLGEVGVACLSISIDGAGAGSHDAMRGVAGSFQAAVGAARAARAQGLVFQINTTVTRANAGELEGILALAEELEAVTFNPFLLVPTGRGRALAGQEPTAEQYERTLRWLAEQSGRRAVKIRVTCAPHYQRILREMGKKDEGGKAGGCLGGKSFGFISHVGKVQICGFLEVEAGDLRAEGYDFGKIWRESALFRAVRQVEQYRGKCGWCEYGRVCGGCRARAYAVTGDYLGAEPFCVYEPRAGRDKNQG